MGLRMEAYDKIRITVMPARNRRRLKLTGAAALLSIATGLTSACAVETTLSDILVRAKAVHGQVRSGEATVVRKTDRTMYRAHVIWAEPGRLRVEGTRQVLGEPSEVVFVRACDGRSVTTYRPGRSDCPYEREPLQSWMFYDEILTDVPYVVRGNPVRCLQLPFLSLGYEFALIGNEQWEGKDYYLIEGTLRPSRRLLIPKIPYDGGKVRASPRMRVWVSVDDLWTRKVVFRPGHDNQYTLEVRDMVLNREVPEDLFIIQVPEGAGFRDLSGVEPWPLGGPD